MGNIQLSKPFQIMLLVAVGVFGALFYVNSHSAEEEIPPSPPVGPLHGPSGKTGATGKDSAGKGASGKNGATGSAGATGSTGPSALTTDQKREAALRAKAEAAGIPFDVYLARRAGKVVIIFFWDPSGFDDRRVRYAVDLVDAHRSDVRVFTERLRYKSSYDGVAQAAKVTRTPGLILLYRGVADSFEGYIDPDTLNEKISRLKSREDRR